ncbi:MotA/TolQ/ExbB proton channel family protein [Evansella clarkii]|uniref:MotA/TolQ/ExbB proton channel family protein n=1 Tax=Evansella clarkii TaxID=79879 RepID=UPI0009962A1C|nr:MotA/TolQ/ExbB proton channel family protein [Evansella clarkii]
MPEVILRLFMSEQQAQSVLSSPIIEVIFTVLFFTFAAAFFLHIMLYLRLKRIRHFLQHSGSMDIEPLKSIKSEFEQKQAEEPVKAETFVQEKFSGWRVFNFPVVGLIKLIQMTVSMFILIGVLGTFIGLTMSLGSIDSTGEQLVENVASVLAGIDVAFYTSIAGMGLSLIMTILLRVANTEFLLTDIMLKTEAQLEGSEQAGMARLIEVSETINANIVELRESNEQTLGKIEKSFRGFQEYTSGLQQAAKDLSSFNEGLSENLGNFQLIFKDVKEMAAGFHTTAAKLNENFTQLFSYLNKMDKRNERMTHAFQETYNKIETLTVSQIKTMEHFEGAVEEWKEYVSVLSDRQVAAQASFEKIMGNSGALVNLMKENNKQFKGIFGDDVGSKLGGIQTSLRELAFDFERMKNAIVEVPGALEAIHSTQADYKNVLADRFDDLRQLNRDFHQQLQSLSGNSVNLEKQLNAGFRMNEQLGEKNHQLISEMNRSIEAMSSSFSQRENQLEAGVAVLKDTLSRYVSGMDSTLGEKLDKVSRNLGEYMLEMNGAVKKEFRQISEFTVENQEKSLRLSQQSLEGLTQEVGNLTRQLRMITEVAATQQPGNQGRIKVGSGND